MPDIVSNPKARRDYHILETFEAGMVLKGTEVKALRAGLGQLADAYAMVENGEVWLCNAHIDEYSHGNLQNHDPKARRKLLLHKSEIRKLFGLAQVKGNALLPLALYWKAGKVKLALAVGKGKAQYDKREALKQRQADRELRRVTMHRMKGSGRRENVEASKWNRLPRAMFPFRRFGWINQCRSGGLDGFGGRGFALLPSALGRLDDEPLLDGARRHANVTDFAIHHRLHSLQIREEPPRSDRSDVRADAPEFLRLAAAPDLSALARAFAGQFTDSSHNAIQYSTKDRRR